MNRQVPVREDYGLGAIVNPNPQTLSPNPYSQSFEYHADEPPDRFFRQPSDVFLYIRVLGVKYPALQHLYRAPLNVPSADLNL